MIKASSGGGKGIRIVKDLDEFKHNYEAAKSESMACFGDDRIYIEKYIENPRHIEFQIIADEYGNIIHLGERECSLHTRIQVEHPITEMITDVDIVKEQLKIASGIKLSLHQEDIKMQGHAIECRINAKDAGTISELNMPSGLGVRVDSAIYCGYTIPPFYDSMIAKLITYGKDREEAIIKMKRSLGEFAIGGVNTNIDFQYEILEHQDFIDGNYDTSFLNKDVSMAI